MISAKMVKELREKTGAGMMDCKKTLTEANGDIEKAVELLREKGLASAAKKAGRIAAEGIVVTYISEDNKIAVALEVNCETDFVAVNESFVEFSNNVAKQIANSDIVDVEALLDSKYMDEEKTIKETLTELIAKIGENMNIRRFEKVTVESGAINSYIHAGGKIGVLVALNCEKENNEVLMPLAKDLAMQVAAANPLFLDETSVDEEALNKEREIYTVQALNEGKPEKIVEKMVEGRIKKYLKEVCLVDQVWVKNGDYTITKLLAEKSKEVGSPITIAKFVRFEKGEGLEKKEENFAEEVQKQMQKK